MPVIRQLLLRNSLLGCPAETSALSTKPDFESGTVELSVSPLEYAGRFTCAASMAVDPKIVADKYQKGVYYVEGQQWSVGYLHSFVHAALGPSQIAHVGFLVLAGQVGTRYTLLKLLGSGSFSSVVSAIDKETQEHVSVDMCCHVGEAFTLRCMIDLAICLLQLQCVRKCHG